MKLLTILFLVVFTAAEISDEKNEIREWITECRTQTGISEEDFNTIKEGRYDLVNDKIKSHMFCFLKKLKMMNDSGDLDGEKIKVRVALVAADNQEVEKIMKKCVVKKDTPEETAFHFVKCIKGDQPKFRFTS